MQTAFLPSTPVNLPQFTLEEFGGGVGQSATVNASAWTQAFSAMYAVGGGVLIGSFGTYNIGPVAMLPNGGGVSAVNQPPYRLTGYGGFDSGQSRTLTGGTIFNFMSGNGLPSRLFTNGLGQLAIDHCTLACGDTNAQPLLQTAGTTLIIDGSASFSGEPSLTALNCTQDMIILGGTSTTISGNGTNNAFQGYGTVIDSGVAFFHARRCIVGQVFANGVKVGAVFVSHSCGTSDTVNAPAPIDINGDPSGSAQFAVGWTVIGPLIEMSSYKYGVNLNRVSNSMIGPIQAFDDSAVTTAIIRAEATCVANMYMGGAAGGVKPYLSSATALDASAASNYLSNDPNNLASFIYSLRSALNVSGSITITGSGASFLVQPALTTGEGAVAGEFKRSAVDGAASAFQWLFNGSVNVNGTQQMNMTSTAANAVNFYNNGRGWGCNGKTGGNMEQNSGTGGSIFSMVNAQIQIKDQTGTLQATWKGAAGSGLGPGFDFNTATPVSLAGTSTGNVRTTGKICANLGLGVGNSAAATTPGSVTKKMEVFDASGASLGFIPIYASIT